MIEASILVTTYNHEKYIIQCLGSIVSQQTNFEFEVLVGVDECNDTTLQKCIDFEKMHTQVKVVENVVENVLLVNGRRVGRLNFLNVLSKAKGKYVARCDGDDFWTDPHKLQKQYDFLEANNDFAAV